jgi:RNA polymerase sigma-70 factor, ECF subfamily
MIAMLMAGPGYSTRIPPSTAEEHWRTLMRGIRARNPESLAALYDQTSRFLYGLALHILRDQADTEEVILDVYQHVWNHAELYDETRGNVWNWLAVVTRHRAIDRLRQANSRRAREAPLENGYERGAADGVPESLILEEERQNVRRAMDALKPGERQAIELAFFAGLTHVEVAERLGAPLGTIKTRIRAGLRRLREALAAAGAIEAADAE